jgi:hypothetical protein
MCLLGVYGSTCCRLENNPDTISYPLLKHEINRIFVKAAFLREIDIIK